MKLRYLDQPVLLAEYPNTTYILLEMISEKRAVVMYSAVGGVDLCDVCPDCIACGGDAVAGDKPCPNPSGCSTVPSTDKPHGAASAHGISLILVLIVELTLHFGF